MAYAPAKFEVDMSNGLGGNAFIRNIWFDPKVTWSNALYIMCPTYLQSLKLLQPMVKEMHLQENTLFDLAPRSRGSRSHKKVPNPLDIMCPMHQQRLMSLHPTVKENMHLQENILFDLDLKCCPMPSTSCDLCTYSVWSYYVKRFRRRCIHKKIHYLTLTPR